MAAILVTGMSGTGKSAALAELAGRGFRVVDTDYGGFSFDRWSAEESRPERLWREDRIDVMLAQHAEQENDETLFVAGCVSNQGRFYPRFAAVVLLSAPAGVIRDRLVQRTTNDFGKRSEERERILADLSAVEPLLRAGADVQIDTRRPLSDVADRLVQISRSAASLRFARQRPTFWGC